MDTDKNTAMDTCTFCPKMCRHACPVAEVTARESHTPQAKMASLGRLQRQFEPWSLEAVDPIWACTGCGHCTEYCAHDIEPGRVLFAGRAQAQKSSLGHPALVRYPERFRARSQRLAQKAKETLPKERFAHEARVALWPGCDAIDKGIDDVKAQLALCDRAGAEQVRLVDADRVCGGYPLLAAGHPDVFVSHAARVTKELRRYRTIIMNCSACVYTMRILYPAEGIHLATEILHTSEYFERLRIDEAQDKKPDVYYHDPCYLARYEQVTEEPRRLLARVAEVKEFGWNKKDTECCGGGGMLPKTMPSAANAMSRRRLREIAQKGGHVVVTSCATCKHMLERNAPDRIEVRDLIEYVNAQSGEK